MGKNFAERQKKIPKAVIKRLSLYSRILQNLEMKSVDKISSKYLGEQLGLNSAQIRKDLAYFGQFGVPGFGYNVRELRKNIKKILQTDREIRVGLVGVGNLGLALLSYSGFLKQGFRFVAAFDADKRKVGSIRGGVEIQHIDNLEKVLREKDVDIIILAVPSNCAQQICDRVISAGVKAILNFVPIHLVVSTGVIVHYVDLAIELESLSYYLR